ncbi:39S ribosomal protein L40, mitochondrial-like [Limulus polyphemus]|uniref:Large ribosomal subunit protein mL40 n=1 Tax=Limulus polyphemus TaxID=6850 RepID=A0ABM1BZW6_LIMPO|nr:39S ribosomal protein L40, mitochondrial-like [Limulus polyphemus]
MSLLFPVFVNGVSLALLKHQPRICSSAISQWCHQLFNRRIHTASQPLLFHLSFPLGAEPLRKKKKIDPAVLKMREERKKRRLEKAIRKLEKSARRLKPIEEIEITPSLRKEITLRKREGSHLTFEEIEEQYQLQKKWAHYRYHQHLAEMSMIERIISAQNRALVALREESEELYQEAIQIDSALIPFKVSGPVQTPPIKNYDPPDGEYTDMTKKWDILS